MIAQTIEEKEEEFTRRWAFLLANAIHRHRPQTDELYVFGVLNTALPKIMKDYEKVFKTGKQVKVI